MENEKLNKITDLIKGMKELMGNEPGDAILSIVSVDVGQGLGLMYPAFYGSEEVITDMIMSCVDNDPAIANIIHGLIIKMVSKKYPALFNKMLELFPLTANVGCDCDACMERKNKQSSNNINLN